MVTCDLDCEVSGTVLGWKVPTWQALLLHRVLPSFGGLCVYITLICFDLALIVEHYKHGANGIAVFCIILFVLPALISLVFTLASPPPGLQTEDSAFNIQIQKDDWWWILMQLINCLFFPIAAIGRYCYQIFWWIEVVCSTYVDDKERTIDAMQRVRSPSPIELYLFLQSFIHAAPHAIVNILDLLSRSSQPSFDKVSIQAISIIASLLRMASTAVIYRRFEREKICGRKYPWKTVVETEDNRANEELEKLDQTEEPIYETINETTADSTRNRKTLSDFIQFSPRDNDEGVFFGSDSDFGSDYLEPIEVESPRYDSDDEYVRPVSILQRVAPRRNTQYTIESVHMTPPPEMPAPRISFAAWAEKFVENVESIPYWLDAPQRSKYHIETVKDEPDLPRYVPRSYIRGLEPQDIAGGFVQYLGWYMFFIARLISISAFMIFYPVIAAVILISHYQIVLLLLIVPKASTTRRCFYIFLAFIYLFCLMEFKIRFRHVRVWHACWMVMCTIETVVFTSVWATVNNDLTSWWRDYVVLVIFVSMLLSYMCLLFYFVLLKPGETKVYFVDKQKTEK